MLSILSFLSFQAQVQATTMAEKSTQNEEEMEFGLLFGAQVPSLQWTKGIGWNYNLFLLTTNINGGKRGMFDLPTSIANDIDIGLTIGHHGAADEHRRTASLNINRRTGAVALGLGQKLLR